ncbi:hypothetical protein OH77DRAFT_151925 [Trametes cingulata]|nr:hypothetical protein OH77DRAFT_151925 [Trametes cingulata]
MRGRDGCLDVLRKLNRRTEHYCSDSEYARRTRRLAHAYVTQLGALVRVRCAAHVCLSTGTGLPMCVGRTTGTNDLEKPVLPERSEDAAGHGPRTPPSPARLARRWTVCGLAARSRLCEVRPQAAGILRPLRSPALPCSATRPNILRGVQTSRDIACCAPPSVRLAGSRLVVQKRRAHEDDGCDSRGKTSSSSLSCLLCEAAHARGFTLNHLVPVQCLAFGRAGLPPQLCSTRRQDWDMHALVSPEFAGPRGSYFALTWLAARTAGGASSRFLVYGTF